MISLDPEFVGSMAPPTKLTTDINGKPDTPFARLPRQHRIKLQGRADETEEVSAEEDGNEGKGAKAKSEEKRRMRGKNKAMKRYLRKQRKNVVDPKAVRISSFHSFVPSLISFPEGCTPGEVAEGEGTTEESQRCGEGCTGRQTTKCSRPFPDLDLLNPWNTDALGIDLDVASVGEDRGRTVQSRGNYRPHQNGLG